MAKTRNLDEAMDKYKGQGGGFFSLKNDKDTAVVRFLVGDELVAEEDWFVVHEIEVDGKKRWMQCTEEGDCPGCRALGKPQIKVFLQLEDESGDIQVWERGRNFISKITGLISRYGAMYNRLYEIERNGKAGDTKTTYELYQFDKDDKMNFEEMQEKKQTLLGELDKNGLILQLSYENMELAVEGEYLPPKNDNDDRDSRSSRSSSRDNGRSSSRESSRDNGRTRAAENRRESRERGNSHSNEGRDSRSSESRSNENRPSEGRSRTSNRSAEDVF